MLSKNSASISCQNVVIIKTQTYTCTYIPIDVPSQTTTCTTCTKIIIIHLWRRAILRSRCCHCWYAWMWHCDMWLAAPLNFLPHWFRVHIYYIFPILTQHKSPICLCDKTWNLIKFCNWFDSGKSQITPHRAKSGDNVMVMNAILEDLFFESVFSITLNQNEQHLLFLSRTRTNTSRHFYRDWDSIHWYYTIIPQ